MQLEALFLSLCPEFLQHCSNMVFVASTDLAGTALLAVLQAVTERFSPLVAAKDSVMQIPMNVASFAFNMAS